MAIGGFVLCAALSGCSSTSAPITTPTRVATTPPTQSTPRVTTLQPTPEQSQVSSEVVGPGALRKRTGEEISLTRKTLEMFNLVTEDGILLVGFRKNVSGNFLNAIYENSDNYSNAAVAFGKDWVRITPKPLLKISLEDETFGLMSDAGLAYGNSEGEILLSITDAAPPKGFGVVGQAQVPQKCVDVWEHSKKPIKLTEAYVGRNE